MAPAGENVKEFHLAVADGFKFLQDAHVASQ
jgi:hypothetical protein